MCSMAADFATAVIPARLVNVYATSRRAFTPSSAFTSRSQRAPNLAQCLPPTEFGRHVILFDSIDNNMAANMPLPVPPRTPTPPPDDDNAPVGPGLEDLPSPTKLGFNVNALSPMSATFPPERYGTLVPSDSLSQKASPSTIYSPMSATFPYTSASASDTEAPSMSSVGDARNPFNFQSVTYMPNKPQGVKNVRLPLQMKSFH